jgi:DNA-binding NarL/FixJ family response regulator
MSKDASTPTTFDNSDLNQLTPREWEVLLLLAEDTTSTEISDKLCISPKSVKTYRARIGEKLLIQGRNELARFARKNVALLREIFRVFNN